MNERLIVTVAIPVNMQGEGDVNRVASLVAAAYFGFTQVSCERSGITFCVEVVL